MLAKTLRLFVIAVLFLPAGASADRNLDFSTHTRYMALGDSLAAGYGAEPATNGYVYLLYRRGVVDKVDRTLFANAGVPSVTSAHVLAFQVPQTIQAFRPDVITLTVGGNDLLEILEGADAGVVIQNFQANLVQILSELRGALPNARLYISNLYTIPQIAGANEIVPVFNSVLEQVAASFGVPVADVYRAFLGRRGLLLIEQPGASATEVHPTNTGYRVMAEAFTKVIRPGQGSKDDTEDDDDRGRSRRRN